MSFQAEQQRQVEPALDVGQGGDGQFSRTGDAGFLICPDALGFGLPLAIQGQPGQPQRHQREDHQCGDDRPAPAFCGAPPVETGPQIGFFLFRQRDNAFFGQRLELGQPGTRRQEAGIAPDPQPFAHFLGHTALGLQGGAAVRQPLLQPLPLANQGFVSHFDGGGAGEAVTVKGEQAMLAKGRDHLFHCLAAQRFKLCLGDAAACILCTVAGGNQTQKHLAGGFLSLSIELLVNFICPAGQRAGNPANIMVSVQRQAVAIASLEQFGQGILQQRQRAGLLVNIIDNGADQRGIQGQAIVLCRGADRLSQFGGA